VATAPQSTTTGRGLTDEALGFALGFVGVLIFSLSLPLTRLAVREFDPTFVGLGRALVAAFLAGIALLVTRQRVPSWSHLGRLAVIALGAVIGFPVFLSWALQSLPAAHGSVVTAVLPLATAALSTIVSRERPAPLFWLAAVVGSLTVLVFILAESGTGIAGGDLVLLGAVALAAIGYVEGARLSRELGSWQTICWATLLAAPVLVWPVGAIALRDGLAASPQTWLAFLYLGVFSMFIGYIAWYRGLALGGTARVSQVQLIQAPIAILWSALLLGETITPLMLAAALIVLGCIIIARRAPIRAGMDRVRGGYRD
jgi:drug/metabolite transporter (DMT)-like permease